MGYMRGIRKKAGHGWLQGAGAVRRGMALCAALLLAAGCALAEETRSAFVGTAAPPDVPACEAVAADAFAGAVLAGDSLADGFAIHDVLPGLQVLGRIGMSPRTALSDTSFKNGGKAVTLAEKLPAMRPDAVYLWLGSNGLVGTAPEKVLADYGRLLTRIIARLPDVPMYLLEVTPVGALSGKRYEAFDNARIDTFNEGLRALAEAHGVYVLPVNALLRDEAGLLAEAYAGADAIHLQKAAYEAMAQYLRGHRVQPAGEEAASEAGAQVRQELR